jgi:hypothetical protein
MNVESDPLEFMSVEELRALRLRVEAAVRPAELLAFDEMSSAIELARQGNLVAGSHRGAMMPPKDLHRLSNGDEIALEDLITKDAKKSWEDAERMRTLLESIDDTIAAKEPARA